MRHSCNIQEDPPSGSGKDKLAELEKDFFRVWFLLSHMEVVTGLCVLLDGSECYAGI